MTKDKLIYKKAYVEVCEILSHLEYELYKKIPSKLIERMETQKDEDYIFELETDIELGKQKLLPETRAILLVIFKNYLATEGQKQKINVMLKESRIKEELKKKEKYDNTNNLNLDTFETTKRKEEKIELIKRESFFSKICHFIKRKFRK